MKKKFRNRINKFPSDMYVTSIGSFIIANYILGNGSFNGALKKYKRYKEKDLNLHYDDLPSLVHAASIFFGIKEDLNLPIAAITTDWGTLAFTPYVIEGNKMVLLPNTEDSIPMAFIRHPKNIYNLKGELLCSAGEEKNNQQSQPTTK